MTYERDGPSLNMVVLLSQSCIHVQLLVIDDNGSVNPYHAHFQDSCNFQQAQIVLV